MSYLINRNVAATALNEAQIEFDANYKGLGEAKKIIDSLPTVNAVVIPDNATNGDVIKALFDIKEIEEMNCCVFVTIYPDYNTRFIKDWWNAPYKKGENNA